MSIPFPGQSPFEAAENFDLGVDVLASARDMAQLNDPWTPIHESVPEPRFPAPLNMPTPGLGPWAADLQLPGI